MASCQRNYNFIRADVKPKKENQRQRGAKAKTAVLGGWTLIMREDS